MSKLCSGVVYLYTRSCLLLFGLSCLTAVFRADAQGKIDIAGAYVSGLGHAPEGNPRLFVLEDGSYVIPYFGGVQTGKWVIGVDSVVTFTPSYYPYPYALWGRYNKMIGDSTRIFFSNFDEGENIIALKAADKPVPGLQRVFNSDANCVPYPSVYKFPEVADTIQVADMQPEREDRGIAEVYSFPNIERYNDFLLYYFKPDPENRPFYAMLKNGRLYFEQDVFTEKRPLPDIREDLKFIAEILKMSGRDLPDTILMNPYYKDCQEDVLDILNFRYDKGKNAFVNFPNYEEGEEYTQPQDYYNRCFILYPFLKLSRFSHARQVINIIGTPLFHATCGEE